jgi:hypothetical protein
MFLNMFHMIEEALEAAKPTANVSGRSGKKGSKRAAKETVSVEEAVGIEEDGIHFKKGRRISCSPSPGKKFFPGL